VKVTNSEIIKSGERELIDTIIGDLDWNMIEEIVRSRHRLKIQDDIDYRQGDLIVHDDQVAYKLDFDVKMTLSVIFDRDGNYLSLSTSEDVVPEQALETDQPPESENMPVEEVDDAVDADDIPAPDAAVSFSSEDAPSVDPGSASSENFSKMASHIAEMISEINDD
jgi:hypothetical protein